MLSGDLEPTGRLAQTWWRETRDAGEILDYDVVSAGTTYWYSDADPLYAFGHGLSWSTVAYDAITLSTPELPAATGTTPEEVTARVAPLTATVRLRNTGARPVDGSWPCTGSPGTCRWPRHAVASWPAPGSTSRRARPRALTSRSTSRGSPSGTWA